MLTCSSVFPKSRSVCPPYFCFKDTAELFNDVAIVNTVRHAVQQLTKDQRQNTWNQFANFFTFRNQLYRYRHFVVTSQTYGQINAPQTRPASEVYVSMISLHQHHGPVPCSASTIYSFSISLSTGLQKLAKFEVLIVVELKIVVTPCGLVGGYRRFGLTNCVRL
jgi:hypothetical protein